MSFTLEIVTPEGKAYAKEVDYVVIPTLEGEIGILPGHIPLITLAEPGELKAVHGGHEEYLAIDKGFVRILGDTIAVLTEAAINVDQIDLAIAEEAENRARNALEHAQLNKDIDPRELQKLEATARFAVIQKLSKQKRI